MPHSVSPENHSTPNPNTIDVGSETKHDEAQAVEGNAFGEGNDEDSQASEAEDQDMTMAEAGFREGEFTEVPLNSEIKSEVKLEDLFADMESDEEFPSSIGQDIKVSSPPEAPASPV